MTVPSASVKVAWSMPDPTGMRPPGADDDRWHLPPIGPGGAICFEHLDHSAQRLRVSVVVVTPVVPVEGLGAERFRPLP